jgi:triphosphoribosyl-dephospho-CoA synthetase
MGHSLKQRVRLASAQADLVRMREALENSIQAMSDVNNTGTITLDDDIAVAAEALASAPDRSALDELLVAAKVEGLQDASKVCYEYMTKHETGAADINSAARASQNKSDAADELSTIISLMADQLAAGTQKK